MRQTLKGREQGANFCGVGSKPQGLGPGRGWVFSTYYGESISCGEKQIMRKLRHRCRQRRPSSLNFCTNSCLNI